jgi:carbonic anhydrase
LRQKAVLSNDRQNRAPNLSKWLHHAHPAAFRLEHEGALDAKLCPHDQLSQLNVLVQLEHLASYSIVRERISAGSMRLNGWWFDVASGMMYAYDRNRRLFELFDRQFIKRMFRTEV